MPKIPKNKKTTEVIELQGSFPSEYKPQARTEIAERVLGRCGKMISGSKSGFHKMYPEQVPVFNANICTCSEKLWYGDINLTDDEDKLKLLSQEIGERVYVLYEMDGRFENADRPLIERAVYSATSFAAGPTDRMSEFTQYARSGKYKGKLVYKKRFR